MSYTPPSYAESGMPPAVNQAINDFRYGPETMAQIETDALIVQRLIAQGSTVAMVTAGQMALDIASRDKVRPGIRDEWVRYAQNIWLSVGDFNNETNVNNSFRLTAQVGIASIPLYRKVLVKDRLPELKLVEENLEVLYPLAQKSDMLMRNIRGSADAWEDRHRAKLSGSISELAFAMLINRYVRGHMPERSMVALASHISEDNCYGQPGEKSGAWDVSVFTPTPTATPKLTGKVQVKSDSNFRIHLNSDSDRYADGIVVIDIERDLLVSRQEKNIGYLKKRQIIHEIALAGLMDNRATKEIRQRLDRRAELALEKIEASKA